MRGVGDRGGISPLYNLYEYRYFDVYDRVLVLCTWYNIIQILTIYWNWYSGEIRPASGDGGVVFYLQNYLY